MINVFIYQDTITYSGTVVMTGIEAEWPLFIKDIIQFKIREDIRVFIPHIFESLFIEIDTSEVGKAIVGVT